MALANLLVLFFLLFLQASLHKAMSAGFWHSIPCGVKHLWYALVFFFSLDCYDDR